MSNRKSSSTKKNERKNKSTANNNVDSPTKSTPNDEISCQLIYQQETVQSLTVSTISVHSNVLKSLGLRNGSYVLLKASSKSFIFTAWSASNTNTTSILVNRKLKSNFATDEVSLSSSQMSALRMFPCSKVYFHYLESTPTSHDSDSSSSSRLVMPVTPIQSLKDYIKAMCMDSILLNELKVDFTWKGIPLSVQLIPLGQTLIHQSVSAPSSTQLSTETNEILKTDDSVNLCSQSNLSTTACYRIHADTLFEFRSSETSNSHVSTITNTDTANQIPKPAGYDTELNQAINYVRLGLGFLIPSSSSSDQPSSTLPPTATSSSSSPTIDSGACMPPLFLERISRPPRGLLIKGCAGVGKSYFMKYLLSILTNQQQHSDFTLSSSPSPSLSSLSLSQSYASCNVYEITPDILLKRNHGETELELQSIFNAAIQNAPSCLVFDDLDLLAPNRSADGSDSQKRFVSCLLRLIDQTRSASVIFIATATRPNSIEKALRRPGRFDKEIELLTPSAQQRGAILTAILHRYRIAVTETATATATTHIQSSISDRGRPSDNTGVTVTGSRKDAEQEAAAVSATVARLAATAHGFVASDLVSLVKEAVLINYEHSQELPPSISGTAFHDLSHGHRHNQSTTTTTTTTTAIKMSDGNNDADEDAVLLKLADLSICNTDNDNQHLPITMNNSSSINSDNNSDYTTETSSTPHNNIGSSSSSSSSNVCSISVYSMHQALKRVSPSAIREIVVEVPCVKWTDIGGMEAVKQALKEVVEWPIMYAAVFTALSLSPPRGVLLYGPPGCSKTLMAKALATESSLNFLSVRGPELLSKWLGESEKAVQTLFRRARSVAPCVIFFDEIDAFATKRGESSAGVNDRVLSQLLTEIDETQRLKQVVVVAATNRPDLLDDALLRPGRFDRKIFVPPPDEPSREQIIRLELSAVTCLFSLTDFMPWLMAHTHGYSGAELVAACQEAIMLSIEQQTEAAEAEERREQVYSPHHSAATGTGTVTTAVTTTVTHGLSKECLSLSVQSIKPQITPEMMHYYKQMQLKFS